ncbi:MAG: hypothetical protein JWM86_1682 [Thermoleophilia bacterium]|nr:hypothetical protein [Thermoleophilia bacterium]
MTISGFNPNTALPTAGLMSPLATGAPTMALGATLPGSPMLGAQAGITEKPGIASRLMSAMKAAVSELRGAGASDAQIREQMLAMQAQAPVTLAKQPVAARAGVKTPKGKSFTDGAGNVREVGTGKILKPTTRAAAGAAPAGAVPTGGMQLPSNATTVPGATVYSYDQNGNPVAAPTMQQLGMTPTMLQGLTGVADAAEQQGPQGPQLNATNQTNVGGLGTGFGLGSGVPVLGQPIVTTPAATAPGDTGVAPHEGTGGNQVVRNENTTDIASRNQGIAPYGYGGYDPTGGFATPFSPYGSSMTGAYAMGSAPSSGGFFSRLLGR